jgi:hypothetical protein
MRLIARNSSSFSSTPGPRTTKTSNKINQPSNQKAIYTELAHMKIENKRPNLMHLRSVPQPSCREPLILNSLCGSVGRSSHCRIYLYASLTPAGQFFHYLVFKYQKSPISNQTVKKRFFSSVFGPFCNARLAFSVYFKSIILMRIDRHH